MTATVPDFTSPSSTLPVSGKPSYARAHWFFLAALAAIVAGFWPSFFRPLGAGDMGRTIHGTTATLWVVTLALQSWLVSRGLVVWHRRVARFAVVLLPVLCLSALYVVRVMLTSSAIPPFLRPLLAFIDLPSIAFLLLLFSLALINRRTPAAHKRFMAATVLLAFPPALTRLYQILFAPGIEIFTALHASFVTVEVILLALIFTDVRMGERRLAYPLSLGFFVTLHALMFPLSSAPWWTAFLGWYAGSPMAS